MDFGLDEFRVLGERMATHPSDAGRDLRRRRNLILAVKFCDALVVGAYDRLCQEKIEHYQYM